MIPSNTGFLEQDFELEEQPTHTYKMDMKADLVRGYTDELEAMRSWNAGFLKLCFGINGSRAFQILNLAFLKKV